MNFTASTTPSLKYCLAKAPFKKNGEDYYLATRGDVRYAFEFNNEFQEWTLNKYPCETYKISYQIFYVAPYQVNDKPFLVGAGLFHGLCDTTYLYSGALGFVAYEDGFYKAYSQSMNCSKPDYYFNELPTTTSSTPSTLYTYPNIDYSVNPSEFVASDYTIKKVFHGYFRNSTAKDIDYELGLSEKDLAGIYQYLEIEDSMVVGSENIMIGYPICKMNSDLLAIAKPTSYGYFMKNFTYYDENNQALWSCRYQQLSWLFQEAIEGVEEGDLSKAIVYLYNATVPSATYTFTYGLYIDFLNPDGHYYSSTTPFVNQELNEKFSITFTYVKKKSEAENKPDITITFEGCSLQKLKSLKNYLKYPTFEYPSYVTDIIPTKEEN